MLHPQTIVYEMELPKALEPQTTPAICSLPQIRNHDNVLGRIEI